MSLADGAVLENRYRIDGLLGQGGMGAVYRATDQRFNAPVAIKENQMVTPESQKQFTREAGLLYRLRHPNLPRVIDHFSIPDQGQYLVMDYVEGEDLNQVLARQGMIPEAQALAWIGQVLDALEYLHNQEVIHRDVKPANVKITPQGQVFLVDFGLAKVYDPLQQTTIGARGVTPGYAPPEQYGQGRTDARTDLYSVGATLYALLTGQKPPDALEYVTGQAHLAPPRQLNPAISPEVEAVILRAMQTRPADRFQTAAEFRAALLEPPTRLLVGEGAQPAPAAPSSREQAVPVAPTADQPPAFQKVKPPSVLSSPAREAKPKEPLPSPAAPAPIRQPPPQKPRPSSAAPVPPPSATKTGWLDSVRRVLRDRPAWLWVIGALVLAIITWQLVIPRGGFSPTAVPEEPTRPLVSPAATQGERIAFVSDRDGDRSIYTMNTGGSGVTRLTSHPLGGGSPSWSPDDQRIVFDSSLGGNMEIWLMNTDGSVLTRLTNDPDSDAHPSWSPDGQHIAFGSTREGNEDIYVMNTDGSGVMNLTNDSEFNGAPSWSPGGRQIAFSCSRSGGWEICVMNADGSGVTMLTDRLSSAGSPSWSPDGRRIAFESSHDGNSEIYVMAADSSGLVRLTNNSATDAHPSWSPDGSRIAFQSDRDGNCEVYVMNDDGSAQTNLTNNPGDDGQPSWSSISIPPPQPAATHVPTRAPTYTKTPRPTSTRKPTSTKTPTSTPTPKPTSTRTPRPTATPKPTNPPAPALAFSDDFSTDKGWVNETSGDFSRDAKKQWLSWHVHRSTDEKYYIPIEPYDGDVRFEARVKASDWANNCDLFFGLAEGLSDSQIRPTWPSGLFVDFGWYGIGGTHINPLITYVDSSEYVWWNADDPSTHLGYEENRWYRIVMETRQGRWTLTVYDDAERQAGQLTGTLLATHRPYNYIVLFNPYDGDWPTGDGLFDDLVVESTK